MNTKIFSPLFIRDLKFRNRIFVSPMCQYSAEEGVPTDWHFVHLGSRAVGGAGLVMAEATAVSPLGRISPGDTGIWNSKQQKSFARIAAFIKKQGAAAGIQLAHAGRKGSTAVPWRGGRPLPRKSSWKTLGPSSIAFGDCPPPVEMDRQEIAGVVSQFSAAARRSLAAGFGVVELHMAHGYLLHEFLSPFSNIRKDEFGGVLENRMRFPLRVAAAVRNIWPKKLPVFVRVSATDWVEGGWDIKQTVQLAKRLKELGVDLIDCSSGGNVPDVKISSVPGYQVPFAEAVKREAKILTGAVGMITEAKQAERILQEEKADVVFLARAFLRDPYWALSAAQELGESVTWPVQYERAQLRPRPN